MNSPSYTPKTLIPKLHSITSQQNQPMATKPVNPKILDGTEPPDQINDWLASITTLCNLHNCDSRQATDYASLFLIGDAKTWYHLWNPYKQSRQYSAFATALRERFFPYSYKEAIFNEFVNLSQLPGADPCDYIARYRLLYRDVVPPFVTAASRLSADETFIEHFLNGFEDRALAQKVRPRVVEGEKVSLKQVLDDAYKIVEREMEAPFKRQLHAPKPAAPAVKSTYRPPQKCPICNIGIHKPRNCPNLR